MVFSSITFLLYFLPIVLVLYEIIPKKARNLFLFIASLFFYAWGEPIYVLLMIFSTVSDFTHGKLIDKYRGTKKATIFLISSVLINLAALGFFKYSDFLIGIINSITGANIPLLNLPLPIGISFYTFQTMSYSIDVYRGNVKPQNNIISFGMFVTLFPQLIAGPIVKYSDIEDKIDERTPNFEKGIPMFIIGLSKKVLIANVVGAMFTTTTNSLVGTWFSLLCYTLQIYFDFSGYSDMAIGLGYMLGFEFPQNFNYPYISKNITEFWRRWHITMSSWFKEYVYIPLGGNKHGLKKQLRNIAIVWLLTGIWHGANFNFILWGIYFGLILLAEKMFLLKWMDKLPSFFKHIYALALILIGWMIFAIEDLNVFTTFFKSLFIHPVLIDATTIFNIFNNLLVLIIALIASTPLLKKATDKLPKPIMNVILVILLIINIASLVNSSYNPFLYFRF